MAQPKYGKQESASTEGAALGDAQAPKPEPVADPNSLTGSDKIKYLLGLDNVMSAPDSTVAFGYGGVNITFGDLRKAVNFSKPA